MNNSEASKQLKQIIDRESRQMLRHKHFLVPAIIDTVKSNNLVVVKVRPQAPAKGGKHLNLGLIEVPLMLSPSISTNVKKGDQGLLLCLDYFSEKMPKTDSYEARQRDNALNNGWFLPFGQDPKNTKTSDNIKLDAREGKLVLKNKQGDLKKTLEDLIDLVQTCFTDIKNALNPIGVLPKAPAGDGGETYKGLIATNLASSQVNQKVSNLKNKLEQLMDTEN